MPGPMLEDSKREFSAHITKKGNLCLVSVPDGYDDDNGKKRYVFQAWPPRAWKISEEGVRGTTAALSLKGVENLVKRSWTSRAAREKLEWARIYRSSYTHGARIPSEAIEGEDRLSIEGSIRINQKAVKSLLAIPVYALRGDPSPIQGWWEAIPLRVRRILAKTSFVKGWDVMKGCYRSKAFLELIESSPSLGIAVITTMGNLKEAKRTRKAPLSLPSLERLSKMKRVEIVRTLMTYWRERNYISTPSDKDLRAWARVIEKSPAREATLGVLFAEPPSWATWKTFRHTSKTEMSIMGGRSLSDLFRTEEALLARLSTSAIKEFLKAARRVKGVGGQPRCISILGDLLAMETRLAGELDGYRPRRIRSLQEAGTLHDEAITAYNKMVNPSSLEPFPHEPPLPGWGPITPITSPFLLGKEGREMHHCVGSYSDAVKEGRSYVYKAVLEGGERATIEVRVPQTAEERPFIAQIYGPCNQEVSERMAETATHWVEKFNGSYRGRQCDGAW